MCEEILRNPKGLGECFCLRVLFSQRVNRPTEEKVSRCVQGESKEQRLQVHDLSVGNTGYECLDMFLYLDKDVNSFAKEKWSEELSGVFPILAVLSEDTVAKQGEEDCWTISQPKR